MMKITSYFTLDNSQMNLNGDVTSFTPEESASILNHLYRKMQINYSKFHKMDDLSKLGIIGIETIDKAMKSFESYEDDEIAMLFMNSDSSLDTDIKHQETLNLDKSPSPAVFVYTLPNIVMGEVAIRMKWHGENLFILDTNFDLDLWLKEAALFLNSGKAKAVVGGWINAINGQLDLKLFFAESDSKAKEIKLGDIKLAIH